MSVTCIELLLSIEGMNSDTAEADVSINKGEESNVQEMRMAAKRLFCGRYWIWPNNNTRPIVL